MSFHVAPQTWQGCPVDKTGTRLRKRYGVPRDACVTCYCVEAFRLTLQRCSESREAKPQKAAPRFATANPSCGGSPHSVKERGSHGALRSKRCARNYPWHPCDPWSVSDPVQLFNDLTAAKQFVFIRLPRRSLARRRVCICLPRRSPPTAGRRRVVRQIAFHRMEPRGRERHRREARRVSSLARANQTPHTTFVFIHADCC